MINSKLNLMRIKISAFLFVFCLTSIATKPQETFFIEESCIIHYTYAFDTGNGFLLFGTTNTLPIKSLLNQDFDRVFALRTDYYGNILSKKKFDEYKSVILWQVLMTPDSSYVMLISGGDGLYCHSFSIIVKIDVDMNILWNYVSNIIPGNISLTTEDDIILIGKRCALNHRYDKSLTTKIVKFDSKHGSVEYDKILHKRNDLNKEILINKIENKDDLYSFIDLSEPGSPALNCEIPKIVTSENYYKPEKRFNYALNYIDSKGHTIKNEVCFNFKGTIDDVIYDTLNNYFICLGTKEIIKVDSSDYRFQIFVPIEMISYERIFALVDTSGKLIYEKLFNNSGRIYFYDHQLLSEGSFIVIYKNNETYLSTLEYFTYKDGKLSSEYKQNLNIGLTSHIKNIVLSKSHNEIFIFYREKTDVYNLWLENLMLTKLKLP